MTLTFDGILVRDGLDDNGAPYTGATPYRSPDIIPYRTQVLSYAVAAEDYGQDLGLGLLTGVGSNNNVYVRAKNLNAQVQTGTVQLYYMPASLINAPSVAAWTPVTSAAGVSQVPLIAIVNGAPTTQIPSGAIALTEAAFVLENLPAPNAGDHYCMLAIAQDPAYPVVLPSFATNAAFATWVRDNPAVGWRNIAHYQATNAAIAAKYLLGNVSPRAHQFVFNVVCTGAGVPVGTSVTLQCTDALYPVNETLPAQAAIQGQQTIGFLPTVMMPANFSSAVTLTLTPPAGQTIAPGARVALNYYQIPDTGDAADVAAAAPCTVRGESHALISVGSVTLIVTP